tara:strand:- start:516 stop:671 length:156 start_codon:yes stop_codon:yes gene_type:complete
MPSKNLSSVSVGTRDFVINVRKNKLSIVRIAPYLLIKFYKKKKSGVNTHNY